MLKIFFVILAGLHGLIHILGFLKAYNLAKIEQLTQPISKPMGLMWLVAALLFGGALTLFLLKKDWWWVSGLGAVLVSQVLIVAFWQDAKVGTLPNVLILLVCLVALGSWVFDRSANKEVDSLISGQNRTRQIVSDSSISHLPSIVQIWLRQSNVVGKEKVGTIHLFQSGKLKTKPAGNWLTVTAEQWFTTDEPGFIWNADVGAGSFMQFSGRDRYMDGEGNMLIKLYSVFSIVNASGAEIDQGVAVRYLAEIIWFPSAALSNHIKWESAGPLKAKATLTFKNISVTGVFTFNEEGQVVKFEAPRYYDETQKMESWLITIDESSYRAFEGTLVPTRAEVTWQLSSGNFTWYQLEVNKVEYD